MTDKPSYRWERRRAARTRREQIGGGISTHDLVILTVIMAMLVIVIRIIFIFGVTQGMDVGPLQTIVDNWTSAPPRYANLPSLNDSFRHLTSISAVLFIYWALISWRTLANNSVSLSTKAFKLIIGLTIITLFVSSLFPEHAIFLAQNWFDPAYTPQSKAGSAI